MRRWSGQSQTLFLSQNGPHRFTCILHVWVKMFNADLLDLCCVILALESLSMKSNWMNALESQGWVEHEILHTPPLRTVAKLGSQLCLFSHLILSITCTDSLRDIICHRDYGLPGIQIRCNLQPVTGIVCQWLIWDFFTHLSIRCICRGSLQTLCIHVKASLHHGSLHVWTVCWNMP